MTRDDIIRMAREAGFRAGHIDLYNSDPMSFVAPCSATDCLPELVRFAAIVAAAEREAGKAEVETLRARIEAMEQQEPVGEVDHNGESAGLYDILEQGALLYSLPGAQPAPDDGYVGWYCAHCQRGVDASEVTYHEQHEACGCVITDDRPPKSAPSIPDTHNDMVVGLDYQGAMSCARQRAKKEAGLLYPEGDARKEEMERELAGEYYRQYTTPNQGAKP